MCTQFNDLRSDMVLLYELKNALNTCELELHTLKATYETLCPGLWHFIRAIVVKIIMA